MWGKQLQREHNVLFDYEAQMPGISYLHWMSHQQGHPAMCWP